MAKKMTSSQIGRPSFLTASSPPAKRRGIRGAKIIPNIVCLGGGIGTVNLLKGLKNYQCNITVVVSMADDGASAGRLRRLYSVPPPGDLINCISVLSQANPVLKDLLTFRFEGNRWGRLDSLGGQKLGNLILVALSKQTGDFYKALLLFQNLFQTQGQILPSTIENISIWAKTKDGQKVFGEETIDLGKYKGEIDKLYLNPSSASAPREVINAIKNADMIIAGPGDLYTTIIPVLLVRQIRTSLIKSSAKKIFVVNVANKPFETPNYTVDDYIKAIVKHCGQSIFDHFLVNVNFKHSLPKKLKYEYVKINGVSSKIIKNGLLKKGDFIDESFPVYHDSKKLALGIMRFVK